MSLIDKNLVIELISPIIAVGDVNTSNRALPVAGGFRISNSMLDNFILMGENKAISKLRKYYAYPLQTKEGITDVSLWNDLTKGIVLNYILVSVLLTITSYTLASTGELKVKSILDNYTTELESLQEFLFALDQNYGEVYPALEELVWAEYYLTRQQNPSVLVANPNTKYTPGSDVSLGMFAGLYPIK